DVFLRRPDCMADGDIRRSINIRRSETLTGSSRSCLNGAFRCTRAPRSREDPTMKFSANWTTPLPSPLSGDHRRLSPEARTEIRALIRPRPIRFLVELALAWLTIAG